MPDNPDLIRARPRRERRTGGRIQLLPWRRIVNPFKPLELLGTDELEAIHRAGLTILRDVGVEVLNARALDLLRGAGARVERESADASGRGAAGRVRLDVDLTEELITTAPLRVIVPPPTAGAPPAPLTTCRT